MSAFTAEKAIAAFSLGVRLNELSWCQLEALVTGQRENVSDLLEKISTLLVQLSPNDDGGHPRKMATDFLRVWKNMPYDIDTLEFWNQTINQLWESDDADFDDDLSNLWLVSQNFASLIRNAVVDLVPADSFCRHLLNLGRKLDQGRHPQHLSGSELIIRPARYAVVMGADGNSQCVDRGIQPLRFLDFPHIARERGWELQLRAMVNGIIPGLVIPDLTPLDDHTSETFGAWLQNQFDRICAHLSAHLPSHSISQVREYDGTELLSTYVLGAHGETNPEADLGGSVYATQASESAARGTLTTNGRSALPTALSESFPVYQESLDEMDRTGSSLESADDRWRYHDRDIELIEMKLQTGLNYKGLCAHWNRVHPTDELSIDVVSRAVQRAMTRITDKDLDDLDISDPQRLRLRARVEKGRQKATRTTKGDTSP